MVELKEVSHEHVCPGSYGHAFKASIIDHENKPADFWWFPYQDEEAYPG